MSSKPFNVLYLSSFASLGRGGQESLLYLVTNIDREAFHPHVVLPTEGSLAGSLRGQEIGVTILGFTKVFQLRIHRTLKALFSLLKIVDERAIDLIHTDGPRNTLYAGLVARIKRLPLVWHIRASNRDKFDRILYYLSSRLILVADSLRSRFDWVDGNRKFTTIHNGIDLSVFDATRPVTTVRREYGIGENTLLIATVARVERLKGQKYLIEACGSLRDKLEDFHILLIGACLDLPYLEECRDKAAELGIAQKISFTGHQDKVSQILNEIDIFVLPSLFEAFPRSLIEAMGVGKPVIATNVGGCPEAIEGGVSGFIVPAADPNALAQKLYLLASDDDLRITISKAARMRAERMFSIQQNVRKTEELYREILRESANESSRNHLQSMRPKRI